MSAKIDCSQHNWGGSMKIVVQKFGGTSVKNEEGRSYAISHIKDAIKDGYKVVAVVSAMGRQGDPYSTDSLLSLINGAKTHVSKREQDLLLSCGELISSIVFSNECQKSGLKAISLTGAQAGFRTNEEHTAARIIEMRCDRLLSELAKHDVVIVAGFQGATKSGEITTIGRGGSDTSAAALGAALNAEWIDIFTDVEGVMTADPRIAEKARPLSVVTYNEICNMAYQGAKVIHPRAVEIAMQAKIPIRIRSTYSKGPGTLVTTINRGNRGSDVKEKPVTGIAHLAPVTQIKVRAKKAEYDLQAKVFKAMAMEQISVDLINISPNGVVYTVLDSVTEKALHTLRSIGLDPQYETGCAKVSVVGAGMTGVPGVTAKIVSALTDKGIRILQSADSHTTIWVLVKESDLKTAVNALHDAFELEKETADIRALHFLQKP